MNEEIEKLQEKIWKLQKEKESREKRGDYGRRTKELHMEILKLEERLRSLVR